MIPENYQWLAGIRGMPKTISLGLDLLGTQEVVGKGSNKTIIAWRDDLNVAGVKIVGFSDDDIPWCGLLAAILAFRRMKRAAEVVASPLWARNWAKYGTKADKPSLGDVLVFERPGGGGHVAFYVAEDATAYHVLGGNQGNKVSITRVLKSRLIAARRPPYVTIPKAVRPYLVAASGGLSANEA